MVVQVVRLQERSSNYLAELEELKTARSSKSLLSPEAGDSQPAAGAIVAAKSAVADKELMLKQIDSLKEVRGQLEWHLPWTWMHVGRLCRVLLRRRLKLNTEQELSIAGHICLHLHSLALQRSVVVLEVHIGVVRFSLHQGSADANIRMQTFNT